MVELLKRVGNGEVAVELGPMDNSTRNFHYKVDGWMIEVCFACGEFDYIEKVVSPDGRKGGFPKWGEEEPVDERDRWNEPSGILYFVDNECYERMEKAFNSVERREEG